MFVCLAVLLRYNAHKIHPFTIQWALVYSQSCTTTTTINFRAFKRIMHRLYRLYYWPIKLREALPLVSTIIWTSESSCNKETSHTLAYNSHPTKHTQSHFLESFSLNDQFFKTYVFVALFLLLLAAVRLPWRVLMLSCTQCG